VSVFGLFFHEMQVSVSCCDVYSLDLHIAAAISSSGSGGIGTGQGAIVESGEFRMHVSIESYPNVDLNIWIVIDDLCTFPVCTVGSHG
jgi:hypothetical protein